MTINASTAMSYNWVQSALNNTADVADWMSPSPGPTTAELAANAFAEAQQLKVSSLNSIAVNQGIATQHKKLAGIIDFSV